MRVLTLSSVFPNPQQPTLGLFVRERAARLAQHCELVVVAPVPWIPGNAWIRGPQWAGVPAVERTGGLLVHHPRFLSIPRYLKALDGLLYACSMLPVLRRLRRTFPFELIDAHFAYPDGAAAVLLGRMFQCPATVTVRGTIVPLSRFHLRRIQIRWTLRHAARVVAVSESLRDYALALGAPPETARVIPNGVDTEHFRPRPRAEARRLLDLPADCEVVVSIGSLSARKGHQRVLEAIPAVVAVRPNVLYVVVGGPGPEGDTRLLLHRLTDELRLAGHVRLVGPRPHDEIPLWLAAADLFCLATSNEGRANAILEALACGVPVITTPVGGNAEIVRHGDNGLLVPLGDGAALSQALRCGLATEWDRDGIARAAARQSWDDTATELVKEFRQLLEPPPDHIPGGPASAFDGVP